MGLMLLDGARLPSGAKLMSGAQYEELTVWHNNWLNHFGGVYLLFA